MDGKRSDWDMSTRALAASTLYCAASILGLDTKASPTKLFKIGSEKLSTQYIVGKSIGAGTVHFQASNDWLMMKHLLARCLFSEGY